MLSFVQLVSPRKESEYQSGKEALPAESPATNQTPANNTSEPLTKRRKTGGTYIPPPARVCMMPDQIKDKGSEVYQRRAWEELKKSIVGATKKVNISNITKMVRELFKENIIRGRGVLTRAIIQAQSASPTFTRVYAAMVAIINTKFPEIGELLLKRLIIQYKRGFQRNDKVDCMNAAHFLAHLLNQEVVHKVLILEIVTHLFEKPTDDSVEIAIETLKECGKKLTQLTARDMRAFTKRVRDFLDDQNVDKRVKYIIDAYFDIQKDGFKGFDIIPTELDLVEEDDKCTHLINLDDSIDSQEMLNVFTFDPKYEENEEKFKEIVKPILGEGSDDEESKASENHPIIDMSKTRRNRLRRRVYRILQSSLVFKNQIMTDVEECALELLKLELNPMDICSFILDCCWDHETYEQFFGLLAKRLCKMNKIYMNSFTEMFGKSYKAILLRSFQGLGQVQNAAKFFASLLRSDTISWMVFGNLKLSIKSNCASQKFIKFLFQDLDLCMGDRALKDRVKNLIYLGAFDGLFAWDDPRATRFAIGFFYDFGLGYVSELLLEHNNLPKDPIPIAPPEVD